MTSTVQVTPGDIGLFSSVSKKVFKYLAIMVRCSLLTCAQFVADGLKYRQESSGLRIDYIQADDSGLYECRAEVASQGNLKVQTIKLDVLCTSKSINL